MLISEEFMELFEVPDFVKPYLHHFVTEQEMELIVKLKGTGISIDIQYRLPQKFCARTKFLRDASSCYILAVIFQQLKSRNCFLCICL